MRRTPVRSGEAKKDPSSLADQLRGLAPFLTLGIQLALGVVVLFFLGRWLDDMWGTPPWMMLTCLAIGIVGGIVKFVLTAMQIGREEDRAEQGGKRE